MLGKELLSDVCMHAPVDIHLINFHSLSTLNLQVGPASAVALLPGSGGSRESQAAAGEDPDRLNLLLRLQQGADRAHILHRPAGAGLQRDSQRRRAGQRCMLDSHPRACIYVCIHTWT
jgi:hypothetical protein